ncbi:MAG: site-2 protease family protein [Planctomycetota bacterium]
MTSHNGRRWSIAFGEWWGIPVRLHLLMLLFAALAVGVTLDGSWSNGLMTAAVLLASVVLHEAAHCLVALRLGGRVEAVVLSPIGGLHAPKVPDEPEPQLFVALVGPLTNLAVVAAVTLALLSVEAPPSEVLPLFNPVGPSGVLEGELGMVALKEALWINWALFLLNLLPAYPFDGGPALRAALWPLVGRRTAAVATAYTAQALSALLCVLAVAVEKNEPEAVMPLWAPLVTLAVFLFFSAQRDLSLAGAFETTPDAERLYPRKPRGQDFYDTEWLDEDDDMVLVEQGVESRRDKRQRKREADEASEDKRVDDILARLHETTFEQLSSEDRAILQRASRRYRSRSRGDVDARG